MFPTINILEKLWNCYTFEEKYLLPKTEKSSGRRNFVKRDRGKTIALNKSYLNNKRNSQFYSLSKPLKSQ